MATKPKPGIILQDIMNDRDLHKSRAKVRRKKKNGVKVRRSSGINF